jgi:hypothetical protein
LEIKDTDPVIENSRTMVPLRVIFEALGAELVWDEETQTATATVNGSPVGWSPSGLLPRALI